LWTDRVQEVVVVFFNSAKPGSGGGNADWCYIFSGPYRDMMELEDFLLKLDPTRVFQWPTRSAEVYTSINAVLLDNNGLGPGVANPSQKPVEGEPVFKTIHINSLVWIMWALFGVCLLLLVVIEHDHPKALGSQKTCFGGLYLLIVIQGATCSQICKQPII
jgi:hypothetical protein